MSLVKLCPACGSENAATAARCGCGAFLIGVDFTERASTPVAPAPDSPPAADRGTQAGGATSSPGTVCRFADCAQPNPPGTVICVYCNRAIEAQPASEEAPKPGVGMQRASVPGAVQGNAQAARHTLIRLPAALNARFCIDEPLKAAGAEADLFVVRERSSQERAVLKLYRQGIEPRTDVLERVSRAAPDRLVRLIEHGRDEGVPYELLEYCEHGSLRTLLKGRPLPLEAARTLLVELADAIAHLHECGIVHRDLKPENVLIRGLLPLDLVVTDFGVASVADATMHYTSAARTLRYSAPEAGSNWVGRPTDYWALGMMLVEALTGRHPFDGLSDAVIAHWLMTRPVDVSAIGDARWRALCRGLLTRDPKTRWGDTEIRRWLGGEAPLIAIDEETTPGAVAPYRVGDEQCRTPRELAVALASHWTTGVKDLKRGMVRAWLQNELRDQNLARAAADAEEALELSDDERLLRLLLRLDPGLPPVFKGYDASISGLAALTRKAMEDNNEARQTVLEMLDRRLLALFPGNALQDAQASYERARAEFEQALRLAFEAGAPRALAPDGREWQLRVLLFVLEPPHGFVDGLRASAQRLGVRAAQHCGWYRALGEIEGASPAKLAAMVLLGPAAALAGMESERESVRRELAALSVTIDACPELAASHAEARDHLTALAERSQDEGEVLGLRAAIASLTAAVERSLDALMQREVFAVRALTDPASVQGLRARIGEWAAWRAGEAWQRFGDQIEILEAVQRRSYHIELASQIEMRRVPYSYGAPDIGRMTERARSTLSDVWSCHMPALPEFGPDLKLVQPREVRCPRCGAGGRAELQETWGSMAYPFSTTFACGDKVGVQCQTRIGRASASLQAAEVPDFVGDFVAAHASEDHSPPPTMVVEAPRIPARWLGHMPDGGPRKACTEMLAAAGSDVRADERITRQRLRLGWTGLAEVRYRFQGKHYRIWIPDRLDATPIALEHPLPSGPRPAPGVDAVGQPLQAEAVEAPQRIPSPPAPESAVVPHPPRRSRGGWAGPLSFWLVVFVVAGCLVAWMLNWKP